MEKNCIKNMFVRAALTLLALFSFSWIYAENITAEQALQLAQTFVSSKNSSPGGRHYSPGMTPQLTQEKQVSGLYVFNVADDGGFIIVSNDDRTTPILGFGESGHLAPDSMPSNMRAWLQGYADQIAWLQTHDVKPSRMNRAPRHESANKTQNIAPMVTTKWDQDSPYNNLCPTYSGNSKSATGCVATAMAQVMKYHEWPQGATSRIPGYTTDSYQLMLPTLPSVTFDWANMLNSYWGSSTSAQKTAVATLMKYCGYSVKMDYGPSSGAYTDAVATALVQYFDYNATTQFVTRSHYTYANWIKLIYHELANQRPVVYGGMSTGGGHEFVCDGYKYENGTDFFHINWGWSGTSDNYFVLAALDPDVQGIGGSSSTDGFHFGQDAVIGIQPSTGTGTIADITPHEINLTLVDAYANPSTIFLGQSAELVVKVTNNSQNPYDGDIMLYEETGSSEGDVLSKVFYIEPGETKECVFTFTPTALGSYSFTPFRNDFYYFEYPQVHIVTLDVVEEIAEVPEGLTVCNGTTTNKKVPAYIYYFDDYARSQFVIPAAYLEVMEGGIIKSISFYTNSSRTFTTDSPVDVYFKEVNYTTINTFVTKQSATMVYQGKLRNVKLNNTSGLMTITLSTPYSYDGGNLLIGIENTVDAGYRDISFYGVYAAGASVSGSSNSSLNSVSPTQQNFLPKTTFAYEAPLELADNATDNSETIETCAGQTVNVKLSGRTLYKDGKWNTICLPFDVTLDGSVLDGAVARELTQASITGNGEPEATILNLTFGTAASTLEAGKPYLIKWTDGENIQNPIFKGVTIDATDNSFESGSGDTRVSFLGNYDVMLFTDADSESVLLMGGNNALRFANANAGLGACRAYFKIGEDGQAARVTAFGFDFGDEATGIRSIGNEPSTMDSDDAWYSLDGRKLDGKPRMKGVYVTKGNRVIIK